MLAVAGVYGLSAALNITAVVDEGLVFFRPAPGVSLVAVLLLGNRVVPGIFTGALITHVMTGQPMSAAAVSAIADATLAVFSAYAIRRFHGPGYLLSSLKGAIVLVLGASLLATATVAVAGTAGMLVVNGPANTGFWNAFRLWWLADFAATLVVAPLLAAWARPWDGKQLQPVVQTALLAGVVYVVGFAAFRDVMGSGADRLLLALALLPLLSWAAFRFDHRATTSGVWVTALIAASAAAEGTGPFSQPNLFETALSLHAFIGMLAATSVFSLGAAEEQRGMGPNLRATHDELKKRFQERTRELEDMNAALHREVTGKQYLEASLRESEQRFRNAFDRAPIGMAVVSPNRDYLKVNQAYCDITGYSKLELLSTKAGKITHPDDQALVVQLMEKMICNEIEHFDTDIRLIHRNGSIIWGHYGASAVRDENGEPGYAVTMLQDVTKKTLAEQELREGRQRYRTLVETIPYGIQETDVNGIVVFANKALHDMLGYADEEMLGLPIVHFLPPSEQERFAKRFSRVLLKQPSPLRLYRKNVTKSGRVLDVQVSWNYKLNDMGEVVGFISVITDVTEQRKIEKQLRRYHADLEKRVAARTSELTAAITELESFSYSVSHDLRTPLRAINGFSQALAEDYAQYIDAEGKDYIDRICGATVHMSNLIDGLLNLSRVIRRDLKIAPVSLSDIAGSISQALRQRDPERKVSFKIQEGLTAASDAALIHLLLDNLLENAWKFTKNVKQAVIEFGMENIKGQHTFFVRDNGIGFDMQYVHKLFQPFERLHPLTDYEGTGIGLATVRRIVQRHGGNTWAESSPNLGATFYFTLGEPGLR